MDLDHDFDERTYPDQRLGCLLGLTSALGWAGTLAYLIGRIF